MIGPGFAVAIGADWLRRLVIPVLIALACALVGAGLVWRWHTIKIAGVQAQVTTLVEAEKLHQAQRKKDQAILARRAGELAAKQRELAATRRELEKALAANPAWAEQPLPPAVREALQ